ncbi:glia-derived nexin [Condylostylus longicornis]|uniref:glia-derived nexin n=1 Tax=Condylostylus longicornis TaxID=2530218 RepID=UPI00244DF7C8|nr:glia-derived nexin [Condylostylus longicornis]
MCSTYVTISSDLYTKKITPAEIIADTTNNLAYRIIYHHSISNRNNFAFSPTSLISVLIALYEGSYDRSYSELQSFLGLPEIKDTSRIGLRDIHRRLRTYFFSQDNPLNGLCLNKENVTITPEYEAILKFYGFDLDFRIAEIQTFISETSITLKNDSVFEVNHTTENAMQNVSSVTINPITETNFSNNQTDIITTVKTLMNNTEVEIITTTEKTSVTTNFAEEITTSTEIATEIPELAAYVRPKVNFNSVKNKKISDYWFVNDDEAILTHVVKTQDISSLPIPLHYTPFVKFANIGNFGVELDSRYLFPKETSHKNTINHIFYLNNHETIQTNYKTYNSVLNYKYLASQKTTILELELNSINYNLIIFLPDFNIDIDTAIKSLKNIPSLRFLKKLMKPKWVHAIIPDFRLKGKIYLTNDLQNMGVKDIFEPSRADFSLMTTDKEIYVKHIEQTIDINIKTQPIDQVKGNIAQEYQPIEVAVNHPFLFFIVDKEVDVAIIAGRAVNPLNLRIQ